MAVGKAGLIVYTVLHLLSLILAIFRLVNRIWRHVFWFDDVFAAVTAFGTSLIVGALVELMFKAPTTVALGHHLILGGGFLVIWTSKAQSIMGLGRALYCSYWPERASLFFFLSLPLFVIGAAYFAFALFLCKFDGNCSENMACHCNATTKLVLSTLIGNTVIDAAIIGLSVHIYTLRWQRVNLYRNYTVKPMTMSNIAVFVADIMIWVSYKNVISGHYTLLFIVVNAAAALSVLLSNIATIIGIVKIPTMANVSDEDHPAEDIPLATIVPTPLIAPSEDNGAYIAPSEDCATGVTIVILEKPRGSKTWETVTIKVVED